MLESTPAQHLLSTRSNVFYSQPSIATKKPLSSPFRTDRRKIVKPKIEKPLRDVSVEVRSKAKFVVELCETTSSQVTWLKNGEKLENRKNYRCVKRGNRCMLIINDATSEDAGVFTCSASNTAGTATTSARLYVMDLNEILKDVDCDYLSQTDCTKQIESSNLSSPNEETSLLTTFSNEDNCIIESEEDPTCQDVLSTTSPSEIEKPGSSTSSHSKTRIKQVRVRRKKSKDSFESQSVDWTEEVRKLIREELEKKEHGRKEIGAELNENKADNISLYPPNFVQSISECKVSVGETAHFVYILSASPSAEIKWLRNGVPISLADNESSENNSQTSSDGNLGFICDDNAGCLIISESDPSYSGIYTCVASNCCGSTKCSAQLIVSSPIDNSREIPLDGDRSERYVDRESQTHESRVDNEDQFITDAFKQLETAEKMQAVEDIVIDDALAGTRSKRSEKRDGFRKEKRRKKTKVNEFESSIARMDDNETGEGSNSFKPRRRISTCFEFDAHLLACTTKSTLELLFTFKVCSKGS